METGDKREEAERLYVREALSCQSIAERLAVDPGTVYRWKSESAKKGEAKDWDTQRRIFTLSPRELTAIYAETVKTWMVRLKEQPELLSDSKVADAISKHISVLQKIDTRGQYLGVAIDLIKIANIWLAENEPELKARMEPCWDRIYESLREYATGKGIFE